MNDVLTLKLDGQVVEVRKDDDGRYCLNDIHKAAGKPSSKRPSLFLRSANKLSVLKEWEEFDKARLCALSENESEGFYVQRKHNRATHTYAHLTLVYKYAAFISKAFEKSVYEAFTALSKGDVEEASKVAASVAVPQELIDRCIAVRSKMNEVISQQAPNEKMAHNNYNRMACKIATGYTPKELTAGTQSALEYAIAKKHPEAIGAMIAAMERITFTLMLPYPLTYQDVAVSMGFETAKNKETLKLVRV